MENKAHALAAGIFVVLVSLLLLGLAAWLTRDGGARDIYEISTRLSITGLQPQAAVRLRGVDVGKVSRIGFDPQVPGNVLLTLEIDRQVPLSQDTFATLGFQGVTGLAFVQLDDPGTRSARLAPQDGAPTRIPLRPGLLAKLEERGSALVDQTDELARRLNQLLGEANQRHLASTLAQLDETTGSASRLARQLEATVAQRVDPALDSTGAAMRSVRASADELGRTSAELGITARRLNEKDGPMDRLAEGSGALAHAADAFNSATLPRINRVSEDTSRAVRQLGRTVNNINDNPQSLIFGAGAVPPGPGEPGFAAPGATR